MAGVTLDSGAVIGFERQNRRTLTHIKRGQRSARIASLPRARVSKWIDEVNGVETTAMCPECGIDSVIGAAHCRRYFFKALESDPDRAKAGLSHVAALFRIEGTVADASR